MNAKIIGISRHRIGVDGPGVTTLVAFHGCTLSCKYCLNPKSIDPKVKGKRYTPSQLYDEIKKDNLYFLATGGGVTFGGGEPLLQYKFIKEFRVLCGSDWKINIETALNVPLENVEEILPYIDNWIVDIKDIDNEIYHCYTGKDNDSTIQNLILLINRGAKNIKIRVPYIKNFNDKESISKSIAYLKSLGLNEIEQFDYKIPKEIRYFSEYVNDKVYAVNENGVATVKEIVKMDKSGIEIRIYTIHNLKNPEIYDDEDHNLLCQRSEITKEQYDSFGKTWVFEGYPNVPDGIQIV